MISYDDDDIITIKIPALFAPWLCPIVGMELDIADTDHRLFNEQCIYILYPIDNASIFCIQ